MITPIFEGNVDKNGELVIKDREMLRKYLVINLREKDVDVSVKPHKKQRSLKENSYYWGVIVRLVADEMGVLDDEAHDYLKALFLKKGVEINGKRYEVVRSTTSLSTTEFEYFVSKARIWASTELGLNIPEPNQVES